MEIGKVSIGSIGGILLGIYLIIVGVSALFAMTAIPAWFMGLIAAGAGLLILVGR